EEVWEGEEQTQPADPPEEGDRGEVEEGRGGPLGEWPSLARRQNTSPAGFSALSFSRPLPVPTWTNPPETIGRLHAGGLVGLRQRGLPVAAASQKIAVVLCVSPIPHPT